MSAIAGVFYFEPRQVDQELPHALGQTLSLSGPDGGQIVGHESIALVHRAFHTTEESRRGDAILETGGIMATFDGRLDNREELCDVLGLVRHDASDTALILAGYKRWGRSCFRRFQGDFSIALWDSHEQTVVLARDPFGVTPLFYSLDRDRVIWASTPDAILSCPGVPMEIDEEYIAAYLGFCPELSQSPFGGIQPVRPGHVVAIRRGVAHVSSFWDVRDFEAAWTDQDRTPSAEHAEEFRALFADAVRVRLRADGPVIAELSGGLDSSSVVCMADAISRASNGSIPPVTTLTLAWNGAARDEKNFVSAVEHQRGRAGIHLIGNNDHFLEHWPDREYISSPRSDFILGGLANRSRVIQHAGARIVLTGLFGDELLRFTYEPREAARLVRRGHISRALALCHEHSRRSGCPTMELFWQFGVRPSLPAWMRRHRQPIPKWIRPDFAERTNLHGRLQTRLAERISFTTSSVFNFADLLVQLEQLGSQSSGRPTKFSCLETRYPFLHRPLVEFLISLPPHELARPGGTRWIQRSALAGMLPEPVLKREDKFWSFEPIIAAVNHEWGGIQELLRDSRAVDRGYVNRRALHDEFTRWKHGHVVGRQDPFRFVALEMWLRALERWSRPNRSTRVA